MVAIVMDLDIKSIKPARLCCSLCPLLKLISASGCSSMSLISVFVFLLHSLCFSVSSSFIKVFSVDK